MSSTIQHLTLTAPDISCAHCERTIHQAIGSLDGVRSVEASAATKQVVVEFDPARVSPAQIEATLDEAGYPVQE